MSILADELCLTETQRLAYTLMAKFTYPHTNNSIDNYFVNTPDSLRFLLKAIETNLTNEDWNMMYALIFRQDR